MSELQHVFTQLKPSIIIYISFDVFHYKNMPLDKQEIRFKTDFLFLSWSR